MTLRKSVKRVVQGIGYCLALPFGLLARLLHSRQIFVGLGEFLSLIPDPFGNFIRVGYYRQTLKYCSFDIQIGFGSFFTQPNAEVEEDILISDYCLIGWAKIGKHTAIGSGAHILSGKKQHAFREKDVPIMDQPGGHLEKVTIGENCWIGNGAIIMASLGKQNVIAAGAVVVKDTGDYEIHGGNPAKLIEKF